MTALPSVEERLRFLLPCVCDCLECARPWCESAPRRELDEDEALSWSPDWEFDDDRT